MGNPYSVCFSSLKIRYTDYDRSIDDINFLHQTDEVNVFLSTESILNNLSSLKDIDSNLLLERFSTFILESEIINLCAHYRRFFRDNHLKTRVFFYGSSLTSEKYNNSKYIEDYRSYYRNKYMRNPKYQQLGHMCVETIFPRVKQICEFIEGVHFIETSEIDGSLIPYIIYKMNPERKNFIISTEKYDSQYFLFPENFDVHYIRRGSGGTKVITKFESYISERFPNLVEDGEVDTNLLKNPSFYSIMLSALGDKHRSIESIKGIGEKGILKALTDGVKNGVINQDTTSPELLVNVLPEEVREYALANYKAIDIRRQYEDAEKNQIFNIENQITDRFDHNSLKQLNLEDYSDYPLMVVELTE